MLEIAPLQRGFDLPKGNIRPGDIPVVYSNGIMSTHNQSKCIGPGVITGRSGTIGSFTFIPNGPYWPHNTALWVTNFCGNVPLFIYHLYSHIGIVRFASGSGVPTLNRNDVHKHITSIPSNLREQNKIASFLSLLDDRIETQSKIIEELTTLRSALYDSMFCSPEQEMPKFRIQSFSGKWQLCQLNEICSRKSIKNKDNLYSRVLTIAAQHGLVDQESFFKKRIASENLESYLCLEKGDFAYNKSYSSDYPWGAVKRLSNFDKGIISPLYICFTPKPEVVDPDYLAHYFESTKWHSGISEISGEGARNHGLLNMSVIDYFNTCHRIPGLDEQKAIARRLNAIAHKLQTEQEYLELLNRQKDCFLKQMFI